MTPNYPETPHRLTPPVPPAPEKPNPLPVMGGAAIPPTAVTPVIVATAPPAPTSAPGIFASMGKYGKFFAAAAGVALTLLTQKYAAQTASWLPYLVAVAGALGVYATPNANKP